MLGVSALAGAWPDMPPDLVYISGPGVEGQVEVADSQVLDVLRLGGIEDMAWGVIPAQNVSSEGFQIIRYFEGGEFRMGDLMYYPDTAGARSVVYFDDGAMKTGDRSPYDKKWLYTTSKGDRVLQAYLKQIGATLPDPAQPQLKARAGTAVVDTFTFAFPEAGTWNWSVRAGYSEPETAMPPLTVVEPNAPAAPDTKVTVPQTNNAQPVAPTQNTTNTTQSIQAPTIEPTMLIAAALAGIAGIIGVSTIALQRRRREK